MNKNLMITLLHMATTISSLSGMKSENSPNPIRFAPDYSVSLKRALATRDSIHLYQLLDSPYISQTDRQKIHNALSDTEFIQERQQPIIIPVAEVEQTDMQDTRPSYSATAFTYIMRHKHILLKGIALGALGYATYRWGTSTLSSWLCDTK